MSIGRESLKMSFITYISICGNDVTICGNICGPQIYE